MLPSARTSYVFLIVAALVAFLSFSITGPYNMRIDGQIYITQVEQFTSGVLVLEPFDVALRAFKPFYGIWGSIWSSVFSSYEALQLLNLFFLFGLPFASYIFLREFGFGTREATIGSIWVTTGYPVLKYGLAISTDIGGWFTATLTAALVLWGLRVASPALLVAASVVGFVGGTIKEPGVAGLLFGGLYILFTIPERTWHRTALFLGALTFPALLLEGVLLYALTKAGLPNFLDWFLYVRTEENIREQYQFFKFLGIEASAFHILIVFSCIGIVALVLRKTVIKSAVSKAVALLFATLPALLWIFLISRIIYVQFLFFVPVALMGIAYLIDSLPYARKPAARIVLYSSPVLISVFLYVLAGTGSLFTLLRN